MFINLQEKDSGKKKYEKKEESKEKNQSNKKIKQR